MSTSDRAEAASCWASESSTTPIVKTFLRSLCGPGGGGIFEVVAGTGEVVAVGGGGAAPVVEPVVVPLEVGCVAVVPPVEDAGCELFPPPEETITAASAPPAASTATAAMSQAFLTRQEATLARDEQSGRRAAQRAPREAGRLPLPRREGPGALHRQGQVAAPARAQLLPGDPGLPLDDPAAARARRGRGGDRHGHRGGGAAPGAEPGQAAPAAVQRPPPGRQVVPVHRGHGRGRLPAGHVHARAAPPRGRLLRALREREKGSGDARRAQPRLPIQAVRR